ncbi:MAG: phosphoribosylformylglycinamidine synthase, partial [Bacteroidales bacterium]
LGAQCTNHTEMEGWFLGPRKEMITPWSTNAVEITKNMAIEGISRIEMFFRVEAPDIYYDPMLQTIYNVLGQDIFTINKKPDAIKMIEDIEAYNHSEGLALSYDEVTYLETLSVKISRPLTDTEVYGFSQVNSEHCRHKIFNGTFIINNVAQPKSLFELIKATTFKNYNRVVSAYKDNCAFMEGSEVYIFAPERQDIPDFFKLSKHKVVFSLKAETHNFPTTVEPFNGAATGSGGEIRDRMAGGKGSFPVAGTAVYMVSYPRINRTRSWETYFEARNWLYQTPEDILIKASNGASDFGNKFGQPLICGSVLTFEHTENGLHFGFDKVIMLAGGIGYALKKDAAKELPKPGMAVVLLGGDNYRIGMGGGAVSSVATGEFSNSIELNAVQRSNPEMQKRVYNVIRALCESSKNPIISIHDHGAGGHLNCLSELVEHTGGIFYLEKFPVGDPTLSYKEIICNESQERMGLIIAKEDIPLITEIAKRERAPLYIIGETTNNNVLEFKSGPDTPFSLKLEDLFGNAPKFTVSDNIVEYPFVTINYRPEKIVEYIKNVLQIESVACKDYLTNKVDRSVTGKIAKQQCCGEIQLPLNNLGCIAYDYISHLGVVTSIGHSPVSGLINPEASARLAITEALTNIIWAPIEDGIKGISLSANWMWPCKNPGEDARLYKAVKAASDFAIALGINIPTGKDSLSMTQKYRNGLSVMAPGTVIISAAAQTTDFTKIVEPVLKPELDSFIVYIGLGSEGFKLGGSSFAQTLGYIGTHTPDVKDTEYFIKVFSVIQVLIQEGKILSGHDVSAGGLITTLLEMNFPNPTMGMSIKLERFDETETTSILFSETPALVVQVKKDALSMLQTNGIFCQKIGTVIKERTLLIEHSDTLLRLDIDELRDQWYSTSYLFDKLQTQNNKAKERFANYKLQPLQFSFPKDFTGKLSDLKISKERTNTTGVKAAIIREKGVNGDREMAWALYLAGFDVKDVHMTDLISGRETLEDINFIVFVGGFSNSDVLGSAKGWAGAFLYNSKASQALENFYKRNDTLSLGVCNGCQLMVELNLIYPEHGIQKNHMLRNDSHKFESGFVSLEIRKSNSIMLQGLENTKLGAWIAHGEGKFYLPLTPDNYSIPITYLYDEYPVNPNGSDYNAAGICSLDGRHLAMMPHLERAIYPWNWAYYPSHRHDEVSPWIKAFINAKDWITKHKDIV